MRVAAALVIRSGDEAELRRMAASRCGDGRDGGDGRDAGLARRARIVLLAAEGLPHTELAERTGASLPTVRHWRSRYQAGGVAALADRPRSGRPRIVDEAGIVAATLSPPPERLGVRQWSSRLLARELGISAASVIEVWHKWGLWPRRRQSLTFATDPRLAAGRTEIMGLYLKPPAKAMVFCVEEERPRPSAGRARQRLQPGLPGRSPHDSRRSVSSLRAALTAASGRRMVEEAEDGAGEQGVGEQGVGEQQGARELCQFLQKVADAWPGRNLHVISGSSAAYSAPRARAWLAANPQVTRHAPAAGRSWLDLVEIVFLLAARPARGRGGRHSTTELRALISHFISGSSEERPSFVWIR